MQVFALGKAAAAARSWRDAPTPGASCCIEVRSVRIGEPGTAAACFKNGSYLRTFAYEETTEPLSVYKI